MPTLLHIDSSPLYERSVSRELTGAFVTQWSLPTRMEWPSTATSTQHLNPLLTPNGWAPPIRRKRRALRGRSSGCPSRMRGSPN